MKALSREQLEEKEFYRKTLHSKLLCEDYGCDICKPQIKCGLIEVNYPVNTAGDRKVWKCYCNSTACNFSGGIIN